MVVVYHSPGPWKYDITVKRAFQYVVIYKYYLKDAPNGFQGVSSWVQWDSQMTRNSKYQWSVVLTTVNIPFVEKNRGTSWGLSSLYVLKMQKMSSWDFCSRSFSSLCSSGNTSVETVYECHPCWHSRKQTYRSTCKDIPKAAI